MPAAPIKSPAPAWAICLLAVVACLLPVSAHAQQPLEPAGRILHRFDFEERSAGNYEDLPMHWSRVAGPGLPHYVRGFLATDSAHSGRFSFRLDLNGGSVIYRLAPGRLAAEPGGRYRIRGHVRTTPLRFARARLTAYFVDDAGRTLPGSVRHSRTWGAGDETEAGRWVELNVSLPPAPEGAESLVLEVGLLQPAQLGMSDQTVSDAARDARVDLLRFRQDVAGSAWFDDIVVARVPALVVQTAEPGNIFPVDQPVRLGAFIHDREVEDLLVTASARDADGPLVRTQTVPAAKGRRQGQEGVHVDVDLGLLPAGWYTLEVDVAGREAAAGDHDATVRRTMAFVVLPDRHHTGQTDPRIAVDATHLAMGEWDDLPTLLPTLSAGRVKLAVWSRSNDLGPSGMEESARFDQLHQRLARAGIGITGVFAAPTRELAESAGGQGWLDLLDFAADPDGAALLEPGIAFLISRHARQIDRWQLGRDNAARQFHAEPRLFDLYRIFDQEISRLVATPDLAVPWPLQQAMNQPQLPRVVTLTVPPEVTPRQIPLYADDLLRHPRSRGAELALSIQPIDADRYGRIERLGDLAQRITYALASGVDRVTVPLPFDAAAPAPGEANQTSRQLSQPREEYLVLRTLLRHLTGRSYRGRIPAGPGVQAFLFAPDTPGRGGDLTDEQGVLVIWSDSATPWESVLGGQASVQVNLGPRAAIVDLWGRSTPIRQDQSLRRRGMAEVAVGPTPMLIVGVDAGLTRLRTLVRFDNPQLESSFRPHVRNLIIDNPYGVPLSGRIDLLAPDRWEALLDQSEFAIPPGGRLIRPVNIRFPYNSFAGRHEITARLTLNLAGEDKTVTVPLTLTLGLRDLDLRTVAWREGNDIVIEQTVSNHGQQPVNCTTFAILPGRPRLERLIANLPPGQTAVRRHRFANVPVAADRMEVRSGLRELEGTRILNDRVEVP